VELEARSAIIRHPHHLSGLPGEGENMPPVIFHFEAIAVNLDTGPDIRDITEDLNRIIGRSGIENGLATACIVGSTGSLTTIEYEPGVVQDLKDAHSGDEQK
jgi:hypothetical protein